MKTAIAGERTEGIVAHRGGDSSSKRIPPALVSAVIGMLLASTLVLLYSRGERQRLAFGDGLIYRYVASHLATPPDDVDRIVAERGASIRYGRIGLPSATWLLSGGRATAMPIAQTAVLVLAAGAAAAAASALFRRAGPLAALLPFAAPGFALSVVGGYAEPLAVAFALGAIAIAVRQNLGVSAGLLALAMLTKENAAVVLAGLGVWMAGRGRWRSVLVLATSVVPVAAWYGFVALRHGHIPVLDPYLARASELPGVGLIRSLTEAASTRSAITVALHLALVLVAFVLGRRSLYGLIGAIAGIQVLFAAPFAWRWIGDATRISVFIQLFTVAAIFVWWRPRYAEPLTIVDRTESASLLSAGARA